MKYPGAATSALLNQSILSNRNEGDQTGLPADVKKTFIYNQKLTSEVFSVLEQHPDKEGDRMQISAKIEQVFKEDYDRRQIVLQQARDRLEA